MNEKREKARALYDINKHDPEYMDRKKKRAKEVYDKNKQK